MTDLKLSLANDRETLIDLIFVLNHFNDGVENVIRGLPHYGDDFLLNFLSKNCSVFVAHTEDNLKGIFIFQWIDEEVANLHLCTLDNSYNWHEFFETIIRPEIAKYAKTLVAFLNLGQEPLVRLIKRYGYEPEWKEDIKAYQYLISL